MPNAWEILQRMEANRRALGQLIPRAAASQDNSILEDADAEIQRTQATIEDLERRYTQSLLTTGVAPQASASGAMGRPATPLQGVSPYSMPSRGSPPAPLAHSPSHAAFGQAQTPASLHAAFGHPQTPASSYGFGQAQTPPSLSQQPRMSSSALHRPGFPSDSHIIANEQLAQTLSARPSPPAQPLPGMASRPPRKRAPVVPGPKVKSKSTSTDYPIFVRLRIGDWQPLDSISPTVANILKSQIDDWKSARSKSFRDFVDAQIRKVNWHQSNCIWCGLVARKPCRATLPERACDGCENKRLPCARVFKDHNGQSCIGIVPLRSECRVGEESQLSFWIQAIEEEEQGEPVVEQMDTATSLQQ